MAQPSIFLASASPRRRELLAQLGVQCEVCTVDIDERVLADESPQDYVLRLARQKAAAALPAIDIFRAPVLGSDTAVVSACGRILGKPANQQDAAEMLALLENRTHRVLTSVALLGHEFEEICCSVTEVDFRGISAAEMTRYWHTGEPVGKAGGYAIQGKGALFVREIRGSYSGVMGLPLFETGELLHAYGLEVLA